MTQQTNDFLLTEKQIAGFNGVPNASTLKRYRTQKHDSENRVPPHIRQGGRVFYKASELEQWLDGQMKK